MFNGDFIDRKDKSIEVITLLLALKTAYPDFVFLNRGNHEDIAINSRYGFRNEILKNYNITLFKLFNALFETLPLASVINDKIFVTHGGTPFPDLKIEEL